MLRGMLEYKVQSSLLHDCAELPSRVHGVGPLGLTVDPDFEIAPECDLTSLDPVSGSSFDLETPRLLDVWFDF